jgi:hypothetical protein
VASRGRPRIHSIDDAPETRRRSEAGQWPGSKPTPNIAQGSIMNFIAKLAVPAALALAAFGA